MKRVLAVLLAVLLMGALTACDKGETGGATSDPAEKPAASEKPAETTQDHTHTYESAVTTEETCAKDGVTTFTCSGCGDTYTETIAATGKHHYESEVTTEETCTEDGVMTFTCSGCEDTYTEAIAAAGKHTYQEKITTQASCTNDGVKTFTCDSCGDTYTESIPGGHQWAAATCTAAKACSACGTTDGSALGHTTNNGTCGRCGKSVKPQFTSRGHIEFAEYQGKMCSFDGPWDVRYSPADGEPYDYDSDSFELIFESFVIDPSNNPFVAGTLKRPYFKENLGGDFWMETEYPLTFKYDSTQEYISASNTLEVFTLTYKEKTFHSMTAEEFNAAGYTGGETGTWNGVRFVVSGISRWTYVCYNLNDLAEYFGINRTLKIVEETADFSETHWVISE